MIAVASAMSFHSVGTLALQLTVADELDQAKTKKIRFWFFSFFEETGGSMHRHMLIVIRR